MHPPPKDVPQQCVVPRRLAQRIHKLRRLLPGSRLCGEDRAIIGGSVRCSLFVLGGGEVAGVDVEVEVGVVRGVFVGRCDAEEGGDRGWFREGEL